MASGLPSFFKTPKHRTFQYRPLIYDRQKERKAELEQLVNEYKNGTLDDQRRLERLRGKLRSGLKHRDGRLRQQAFSHRLRLVVILAVLFGLVWLFLNWT